jgi:hypothetical protein
MMPPTRLLEIILGLAIGISRQVLVVASGACGSSALLRLLACPLEFGAVPKYRPEISWSVPTYRLEWVELG